MTTLVYDDDGEDGKLFVVPPAWCWRSIILAFHFCFFLLYNSLFLWPGMAQYPVDGISIGSGIESGRLRLVLRDAASG